MKRSLCVIAALMACSPYLPGAADAQEPAFDCTKAESEVEKLICASDALATLDRELDEVYKAAMAKAEGDMAKQLRTEQRGWIKGRNDCWKANGVETWITASWTVTTVEACIEANYRLRTSELQSSWRLLPPKTVFYGCGDTPANEVVANFFATDPPTIRLERGDQTVTLWGVGDAGEGNYEGGNVSLVQNGDAVQIRWLNVNTGNTDELQCTAK